MLEIGRIEKPHGLQGEVVVRLTTNVENRLAPGAVFETDRGALEVVAARPHQQRWIVRVVGVGDRDGADALRGLVLRAEPVTDADPDALWVHELIGRTVLEADGTRRGVVEAVQDNPASDLLVLDDGALVPLRFVVRVDDPDVVVVEVPDGLFDL